jgi:hypothetical protein
VTEWGALTNGSEKSVSELVRVRGLLETHLVGGAYWQFKSYHDITTTAVDKMVESTFYPLTLKGHVLEGLYGPDGSLQVPPPPPQG